MKRPQQVRDRGSVSIAMLLLLVVTLAGAGLVVDGGRTMAARRHASNTAEAAARAAVATATPIASFDPVTARRAALAYAQRAGVRPADVRVVVGADSVRVTITEHRTTVFLALGGRSTVSVTATGIARVVFSD
jgi:Flp pilus assembly protein TadG